MVSFGLTLEAAAEVEVNESFVGLVRLTLILGTNFLRCGLFLALPTSANSTIDASGFVFDCPNLSLPWRFLATYGKLRLETLAGYEKLLL